MLPIRSGQETPTVLGQRQIASPSLSILEDRLFAEIEGRKRLDPFQSVVVLTASNLLGRYLARQLVRRGTPHLGTYFLSFPDLARALSRRSFAERGMIALPAHGKTVLARNLARGLRRDSYFATVKEHPHFPVIVEATLTDLEDSLLDLQALQSIQWQADSSRKKVTEFAALFTSYRASLKGSFYSEADLLLEGGSRPAHSLHCSGQKSSRYTVFTI